MIYSVVPPEIIFSNNINDNSASEIIEGIYMNEKVHLTPLENNKFKIQRVLSTSLKSYLNPQLQPGNIIDGIRVTLQ